MPPLNQKGAPFLLFIPRLLLGLVFYRVLSIITPSGGHPSLGVFGWSYVWEVHGLWGFRIQGCRGVRLFLEGFLGSGVRFLGVRVVKELRITGFAAPCSLFVSYCFFPVRGFVSGGGCLHTCCLSRNLSRK